MTLVVGFWLWKVFISGHVDDFMFVADANDTVWQDTKQAIQSHFRWGNFEYNNFIQCGVQIQRKPNGTFELSQDRYMQNIKEIPICQERRKQRKEPVNEHEKAQLRGPLGALAWHCNQVGFRFCTCVSLGLSEVPHATVETLVQTNALLHRVRDAAKEPMVIYPIKWERIGSYAWADVGLSSGEIQHVSPMCWRSAKLDRVCRSPGAAEHMQPLMLRMFFVFVAF